MISMSLSLLFGIHQYFKTWFLLIPDQEMETVVGGKSTGRKKRFNMHAYQVCSACFLICSFSNLFRFSRLYQYDTSMIHVKFSCIKSHFSSFDHVNS